VEKKEGEEDIFPEDDCSPMPEKRKNGRKKGA